MPGSISLSFLDNPIIFQFSSRIYDASIDEDPTGGCDHYNNPDDEPYRAWRDNVYEVRRIGRHVFYRSRYL